MKSCTSCGVSKPLTEFNKSAFTKDGYRHVCRVCHKEEDRRWHEAHPDYRVPRGNIKEWCTEHPDLARAAGKRWKQANPERQKLYSLRHNLLATGTLVGLTYTDLAAIRSCPCWFCGSRDRAQVAHGVALSKGGLTSRGNVFPLCRMCNTRMATRSLAEVLVQVPLI